MKKKNDLLAKKNVVLLILLTVVVAGAIYIFTRIDQPNDEADMTYPPSIGGEVSSTQGDGAIINQTNQQEEQEIDKERCMQWIREQYYAIENNIDELEKYNYPLNEFDTFIYYIDGNDLKKVELYDNFKRTTYYFHDNALFFVFIEDPWDKEEQWIEDTYVNDYQKPFREERIYVHNDQIIEALIRENTQNTFEGIPNRPHSYSQDEVESIFHFADMALGGYKQEYPSGMSKID